MHRPRRSTNSVHFCAAAVAMFVAGSAGAAPASFTLDPADSFLILGGTVNGAQITQQGNGSLRSIYTGNVTANLTPAGIEFIPGNSADATVTGDWQPLADGGAGTSPADYGGRFPVFVIFTAFFAARDVAFETSSGPLALSNSGTFASNGLTVTATRGDVAYRTTGVVQTGVNALTGASGQNQAGTDSTLSVARNGNTATATLFVPASAELPFSDPTLGTATLTLNGQFRASVTSIGGDTNFDRIVDIDDFGNLAASFNSAGSWLAGDFDGNGTVDIDDFGVLASNFNQTAPAGTLGRVTVPEPGAAGAVIAALLPRRRRKM